MITQEDIDRVASGPSNPVKVSTEFTQWAIRNAFEEGYRAAKNERGMSVFNPNKGKWFDAWVTSKARAMLVTAGVINSEVTYK